MKQYVSAVALVVAMFLFSGSQDQDQETYRESLIAQGVEIRVEEFRSRQERECRDRAIAAAVSRVDSIMRELAPREPVEQIDKPPKPTRPTKPTIRKIPDTLQLH